MAAHVLTAMNEILTHENSNQFSQDEFAFGHAAFGNQLELSEYTVLSALAKLGSISGNEKQAKQAIRDFYYNDYPNGGMYKRLSNEWESLNQPTTYDEWMNRKFKND